MDLAFCQRVAPSAIWTAVVIVALVTPLPVGANVYNSFGCPQKPNCSCVTTGTNYEVMCPPFSGELYSFNFYTIDGHASLHCSNKVKPSDYWTLPILASLSSPKNVFSFSFASCPLPDDTIVNVTTRLGISKQLSVIRFQAKGTNMTTMLKRSHLAGLENVTRFVFSGYPFAESNDIFEDTINVEWLTIRSNKLHVHPDLFKPLTKLRLLEMGNSELTSLPKSLFKYLNSLEALNLWHNKLTNLTYDTFEGLDSLKDLDLSGNELSVIHSDVFQNMPKLKIVSLGYNRFSSLPENLFANNSELETFELRNNYQSIVQLPDRLLSNLTNLKEVDMDDSKIESVAESLFFDSVQIINITLSGNKITVIPNFLFRDQINLIKLDLKDNKISSLPDTAFQTLINLQVLILDNNYITKISANLFARLLSLQTLKMKNNKIKLISYNAFQSTLKLEYIDMSYNSLNFLDNNEFTLEDPSADVTLFSGVQSPFNKIDKLKYLHLSHNNISNICTDWRLSKPTLKILDLSYNQINHLQFTDIHFLSWEIEINLKNNQIFDINFTNAEENMEYNNMGHIKVLMDYNPIQCTCTLHHFINYQQHSTKDSPINVDLGNTTCVSPPELKGVPISELTTYIIFCPLDSPYTNEKKCPENCTCNVRIVDRALNITCPRYSTTLNLPDARSLQLNYTEFHYKNNSLNKISSLGLNTTVLNEIRNLYVSGNNISQLTVEDIPEEIEILDLRSNKISYIESDVLDKLRNSSLKNMYLSDNPIQCDCLNHPFLSYLQVNYLLIEDMKQLKCSNGEYISKVKLGNLCGTAPAVVAFSIIIAVLGVLLGFFAALYYKYQEEIKIWLFWHDLLPRCCQEAEQEKTYDAFISFSHKDEDFVINKLLPELEGGTNPFKICLHFRDWMVGEWIPTQIVRSVQDSRRTVVVLSQNFLESVWGRLEFRTAHSSALKDDNVKVIVILYGDIGPTDKLDEELQAYLSMNTYVKWGDPWFWRKLKYALPHPTSVEPILPAHNVSRKKGFDDRLELIHSSTPSTPPGQNTPPAHQAHTNPLMNHVNTIPNGVKSPNGLNGTITMNGLKINGNAKHSDV